MPRGDPYIIPGYGQAYRNIFKSCFKTAVGADDDTSLISAFGHAVNGTTGNYLPAGQAALLAEAFWSHHCAIAKLAGTDAWRRLQQLESSILLEALAGLEKEGIVAIPIHDSIIVQARYGERLRKIMNAATWNMTARMPALPVTYDDDA